jgi:tripartite-type tricarboxylate transporter receptor subunit TctC
MDGQRRPRNAAPTPLLRASPISRRAALAGLAACAAAPARAQSPWPDRAITLVHGLAPGGPSDIIARIIAFVLREG